MPGVGDQTLRVLARQQPRRVLRAEVGGPEAQRRAHEPAHRRAEPVLLLEHLGRMVVHEERARREQLQQLHGALLHERAGAHERLDLHQEVGRRGRQPLQRVEQEVQLLHVRAGELLETVEPRLEVRGHRELLALVVARFGAVRVHPLLLAPLAHRVEYRVRDER